jgi:hypothetical protein
VNATLALLSWLLIMPAEIVVDKLARPAQIDDQLEEEPGDR